MFITAKKKLPSLHVNLKRTKFSEVNTPSNRFFELNFFVVCNYGQKKSFLSLLRIVGGSFKDEVSTFQIRVLREKKFCWLFCSIFFSLVRYLYNARINDQEGEKRMGFFWLDEKPQDYKKWLVISLSYYFLCNWKKWSQQIWFFICFMNGQVWKSFLVSFIDIYGYQLEQT